MARSESVWLASSGAGWTRSSRGGRTASGPWSSPSARSPATNSSGACAITIAAWPSRRSHNRPP